MVPSSSVTSLPASPDPTPPEATRVGTSEDRYEMNTARIATGDRDAIVVAHSIYERIGMSRGFRGRVFREPIDQGV